MGREVRRVPKDWRHPRYTEADAPYPNHVGRYKPLFEGTNLEREQQEWDAAAAQWNRGFVRDYSKDGIAWKAKDPDDTGAYEEYAGKRPDPADHMPNWTEAERTHFMMYEDTSEGTPISPAFETPEELAKWLVDNEASAFGGQTASYEGWLRVARGGLACSAIIQNGVIQSGVDGLTGNP